MRIARRSWLAGGLAIAAVGLASSAGGLAQQPASPAAQNKESQAGNLLEAMRQRIAAIDVRQTQRPAEKPCERIERPLMRYSDQPRGIVDATLWGWGSVGRPVAVCKVESYRRDDPNRRCLFCFVSLAADLITAQWSAGRKLSTTEPGLTMTNLAHAAPPGESPRVRLRQMKELARQFSVTMSDEIAKTSQQMRLLTQPLYRYEQIDAGLVDGAIFAFSSNGTNPDALLIVEAHGRDGALDWRQGWARLTTGGLLATREEKTVWSAPYLGFGRQLDRPQSTFIFGFEKGSAD